MFVLVLPWRRRGKDDPAVFRIQCAAKWHMEIQDRELTVMVFPVHLHRGVVVEIVEWFSSACLSVTIAEISCATVDLDFLGGPKSLEYF